MESKIRVLVVDDAELVRCIVKTSLDKTTDIEVVGEAGTGVSALEQVEKLRPDVVVMDVEMPIIDGETAVKRILEQRWTPIIMLTGHAMTDSNRVFDCLQLGAVDFVQKGGGAWPEVIGKLEYQIRTASTLKEPDPNHRNIIERRYERQLEAHSSKVSADMLPHAEAAIALASSTGGIQEVRFIMSMLPENVNAAILVNQHMWPGFTLSFAQSLDWCGPPNVKEAQDGDILRAGMVLVVPSTHDMTITEDRIKKVRLTPNTGSYRPTADTLLKSMAQQFGRNAMGIQLSGCGHDGREGMRAIKKAGGIVIAENPEGITAPYMPKAVIEAGLADQILPLQDIPHAMNQFIGERSMRTLPQPKGGLTN